MALTASRFADPQTNILQMGLTDGMKVVDIGTGSGHYAFAAAKIVGDAGRVYALDVQEDVLIRLKGEAAQRKIRTIETIWGDVEKKAGTLLKDQAADAVILSNVLFQLSKKDAAVEEIKRILKPGGKLLVIDWAGTYNGMGPHQDAVHAEHDAEALFIGNGFHKVKSFRGGAHHYAILFTSP